MMVNHWFTGVFYSKHMQFEAVFVTIAGFSTVAFKLLNQNTDESGSTDVFQRNEH